MDLSTAKTAPKCFGNTETQLWLPTRATGDLDGGDAASRIQEAMIRAAETSHDLAADVDPVGNVVTGPQGQHQRRSRCPVLGAEPNPAAWSRSFLLLAVRSIMLPNLRQRSAENELGC